MAAAAAVYRCTLKPLSTAAARVVWYMLPRCIPTTYLYVSAAAAMVRWQSEKRFQKDHDGKFAFIPFCLVYLCTLLYYGVCVRIGFTAIVYNITRLKDGLRRKRAFSVCIQYASSAPKYKRERCI